MQNKKINLEEIKMTHKQIYVSLSAGHSSTDCGAVAADGTTEAELVTQFRNIVAYYMQQTNQHLLR